MCGIVGYASTKKVNKRHWLDVSSHELSHRGPDDQGLWISNNTSVGFAHRRLSIIDLSQSGHQPMIDKKNGNVIVFNGEIYNYKELRSELKKFGYDFFSTSDTEVILASYDKWGTNCISKLNGMFAFAIYDNYNNIVLLARDRSGEKPLFYFSNDSCLYFASELKALFANNELPRKINYESLDCFLSSGYIPGENCIIKGYKKLPPAHALIFNLNEGNFKIWKYWDIQAIQNSNCINDESQLLNDLEYLLQNAVEKQLVSDVNVGVLLSGGVDSSLITAMASRASSNIDTFTLSIPGHALFDESKHARLISNYFGTNHTELMADVPNSNLLIKLASQFDEPIIDSSMIPTFMISELISKHCKVALGGDGGDELFGGYGHYSIINNINQRFGALPLSIRKKIAYLARTILPIGVYGRNWLQLLGQDLEHSLSLISPHFDQLNRRLLLKNKYPNVGISENIFKKAIPNDTDLISRATKYDFQNYLAEIILVKVDRASMLNSLEIRAPFLDKDLIEFAFSMVPSNLKVGEHESKILLKRLAKKILPKEFNLKRKQGFSIPLGSWILDGEFKNFFKDVLLDNDSIFDKKTIIDLFDGQKRGRRNQERLFGLVMLELWKREYKIDFS
jgi:asparagine synthase (glutamine-hydrolysing)